MTNKFILKILFLSLLLAQSVSFSNNDKVITPHKFTDEEWQTSSLQHYDIPQSCRFVILQRENHSLDLIYYFSRPKRPEYPIAILVGGSSSEKHMVSIIHFHRYFLKEFLDLGIGVITLEQRVIDGNRVNSHEFMMHYTRSNRLSDHRILIEHIKNHPSSGWTGKLIFLGVSEGGLIVTTLTQDYVDMALATINWCGASDLSWDVELWSFIQAMSKNMKNFEETGLPRNREEYDTIMAETFNNPTPDLTFMGMTYKYHADALKVYENPKYEKIKTPFLVVTGTQDSLITSSDSFVKKAKEAKAPITYMRVPGMDHYIRKREDMITESFLWLKTQLSL